MNNFHSISIQKKRNHTYLTYASKFKVGYALSRDPDARRARLSVSISRGVVYLPAKTSRTSCACDTPCESRQSSMLSLGFLFFFRIYKSIMNDRKERLLICCVRCWFFHLQARIARESIMWKGVFLFIYFGRTNVYSGKKFQVTARGSLFAKQNWSTGVLINN